MAIYELDYAQQPDLCIYLPDGVNYARFEGGKYSTDDKEVYKHLKKHLGEGLVRTNKPAKEEDPSVKAEDKKTEDKKIDGDPDKTEGKKPKAEK